MPTISDETRQTISRAEGPDPGFVPETDFTLNTPETAPGAPPAQRRKGGRGNKGPNWIRNAKKKGRPIPAGAEAAGDRGGGAAAEEVKVVTAEVHEPPKTLVRGCRWMLRNIVLMMKEGYGWDEPEDYEEWLQEASQFGAACVQKHFPDWMERWGDEILLLAMLLIWVTPNVGKELRKRRESNNRNARPQGQREDNETLRAAKSA